jgi:Cupin-like domain
MKMESTLSLLTQGRHSAYAIAAEMSTARGDCIELASQACNAQCSRCSRYTVGHIERPAKCELADPTIPRRHIAQKMDRLCKSVLSELRKHSEDDPIRDCGQPNLHDLPDNVDKLFDLAYEKLYVFPFVEVKSCWFRLYTDTSIAKAVKKIPAENVELQYSSIPKDRLDEIVSILDMALIMAGGLGREDMIHNLLKQLQDATEYCEERPAPKEIYDAIEYSEERSALKELLNSTEYDEERPAKKRKVDTAAQLDDIIGEENLDRTSSMPDKDSSLSAASEYQPVATTDKEDNLLSTQVVSLPTIRRPVRRTQAPSSYEFQNYMNIIARPLIVTGIMGNWPALEKWNSTAFWLKKTFDGKRLVPIEVGRSYTDDGWGQKIVPFGEFLDDYILEKRDHQQSQGPNEMLDNASEERLTGYLAQHDLFQQIPSLWSDIAAPDYCYLDAPPPKEGTPVAIKLSKGSTKQTGKPSCRPFKAASQQLQGDADSSKEDAPPNEVHTNMWFGPEWTISPLHHDPYHNILCQVVGKKYVRLYSPDDSHRLYPRSHREEAPDTRPSARQLRDGGVVTSGPETEKRLIDMSNTSKIDVAEMELSPAEDWDAVYPGISQVPYVECILEAGEALYIPVGWWHYVRSCSVGISVSFWW